MSSSNSACNAIFLRMRSSARRTRSRSPSRWATSQATTLAAFSQLMHHVDGLLHLLGLMRLDQGRRQVIGPMAEQRILGEPVLSRYVAIRLTSNERLVNRGMLGM